MKFLTGFTACCCREIAKQIVNLELETGVKQQTNKLKNLNDPKEDKDPKIVSVNPMAVVGS